VRNAYSETPHEIMKALASAAYYNFDNDRR
jgi:hypothetical protein